MANLDFKRPAANDKYFLTQAQGGYSNCIAMPNCVTYWWGFYFKAWGNKDFSSRVRGDPPVIWSKYKSFKNGGRGTYPRVGAAMIWRTGYDEDGNPVGHIAVCKSYKTAASVTWVESNYSARKKGKESLYWREVKNRNPKNYVGTFLGYIYLYTGNPYTYPTTVLTRAKYEFGKIKTGNDMVRWAQYELQKAGCYNGRIDGFFGPATEAATREFQRKYGLEVDGRIGPITRQKLEVV